MRKGLRTEERGLSNSGHIAFWLSMVIACIGLVILCVQTARATCVQRSSYIWTCASADAAPSLAAAPEAAKNGGILVRTGGAGNADIYGSVGGNWYGPMGVSAAAYNDAALNAAIGAENTARASADGALNTFAQNAATNAGSAANAYSSAAAIAAGGAANSYTTAWAAPAYTLNFNAAANLSAYDLVILNSSGQWTKAAANSVTTAVGALGMVAAAANGGEFVNVYRPGAIVTNSAWAFQPGSANATLFMSATPGAITTAAPNTVNYYIRVVGNAAAANKLSFMPSPDWFTSN